MANKKEKELRAGVIRVVNWLDNNWHFIKTNDFESDKEAVNSTVAYYSVCHTIEMLGGDWQRDENGKHRVFIAGVGGKAETE